MAHKKGDYIGSGKNRKQWNGRRWVPRPERTQTTRTNATRSRTQNRRSVTSRTSTATKPTTRTPRQAMNADKDSSYRVSGITYDRATGRPVDVPENRKPVQAKDRRQPSRVQTPPSSTPRKPTAAGNKDAQSLRQGRQPATTPPKRKPRTWLTDNYKPGKPKKETLKIKPKKKKLTNKQRKQGGFH